MKARLEFMETVLMILATTFLIESIIFCFMFVSREKQERRAEEYKIKYEDIHDQYNVILLEKARLEEKNWKLETEVEELNKAVLAALTAPTVAEPQQEEPEPSENAAKERLPEVVATNRYDCEGYKFPAGTQQAMLQEVCVTDWEPQTAGLRFYADGESFYFCVAMGGAYGIDIGDAWRVTLANGAEFNVVLADYQHDISDPDPDDFGERYEYDSAGNVVGLLRNYDGEICVHVLEFIADIGRLPQEAKDAGGMHGVDYFGGIHGNGGNIVKLKYLGRKWEP